MPKLCVRVEEDTHKIMERIKRDYGLDYTSQANLALSVFIPVLYGVLKQIEMDATLILSNKVHKMVLEEYLRAVEAVSGGGGGGAGDGLEPQEDKVERGLPEG